MWRALFLAMMMAFTGASLTGSVGHAQSPDGVRSPVLIVDSEVLYLGSAFGLRVARDQERLSAALAAENLEIERALSAEEQSLTALRATTAPDAFRLLADEFDTKVRAIRARQMAKTQELTQFLDQQRVVFLQSAGPVLESLMREAGAAVLLNRHNVFFSADAVDITSNAILRINASLGEGAPLGASSEPAQD